MNARLRAMLTLSSNPWYSLLLYGKPCSKASVHQAKVLRTLFERSLKIHLSLWVSPSSCITWAFLCHINQLLVHHVNHEMWHYFSFPNSFSNPTRYLEKQLLWRCICSTCAQHEPRWAAHTHHRFVPWCLVNVAVHTALWLYCLLNVPLPGMQIF